MKFKTIFKNRAAEIRQEKKDEQSRNSFSSINSIKEDDLIDEGDDS